MDTARFRECLDLAGWSQRGLADFLGVHETRIRRMANGRVPIPAGVEAWLEGIVDWHRKHPPPRIKEPREPSTESTSK